MTSLIRQLTAAFGPPQDRPSPGLGGNAGVMKRFKIDDENGFDCYAGFCRIAVTVVPGADQFLLEIQNSPHNPEVARVVEGAGGEFRNGPNGATICIAARITDSRQIRDLAKAIRRTTARGERYPDRNWKWIAPGTADALQRLATCLASAMRARRTTATTR